MMKGIKVIFLVEAESYYDKLPQKIKDKFTYSFYKTENGYRGDWFAKLKNSNGIFEFRQRDKEKFYRLFAFWDSTANPDTLIVCAHGFNKKTNKTPVKEIAKVEAIKNNYFKSKSD